MSIALRTKYLSIKKEKLSETGKTVLKSMYDATDGFKDAKATRKIKPKFEAFYDKLKKSKPEAIKGATKPKETPTAKQFKEARERRKSQTGVPKKESDIKKDADRPAIDRKGKRVTDGTHYPYKKGNVYYEYRDNRYDKRPAKYPKLEDGGHVQGYDDREDERLSMEHGKMANKDLNSTHARRDDAQFEERMAYGGMTPGRWYKDNQGNEFKYIGPDSTGRVLFNDGERVINKSLDDFEPNVKENKMFGWFEDGGETHRNDGGDQLFADGGQTDNGNVEMVMSNTKAIEHHAQELKKLVDKGTPIEAWVVAKLERAETDLSDVTHYIDGLKSAKFEDGGEVEGHDVEIFFSTKEQVADPYTVVIDGSVYSMSGTTGPYSVNLYVGEIDEFSPQAVKGWGKKINFVNADPELISQIESRFEDEMAKGGKTKKGDIGKSGTQYGYTLKEYEEMAEKNGLFVSPEEWWSSQEGKKYTDSFGRTKTIGSNSQDERQEMQSYGYRIAIGMDLGSDKIPASARKYVIDNNLTKEEQKYAKGGETKKDFKVDDVVYHKGHNTVGIVRIEESRGELKTDADGNVDVDELEYYNPLKHESHKSAKIAPSTKKEIEERGLWKPYSERTSKLDKGGHLAEKTSVEVGNEKISVIKRRKEKTGYPVYVNTQGYAPMTLDVYPTKELAKKKAKALANKEGYTFSNWEKVGEFNLEPYAKGGRLSRKQKQLDLNKNGKLDSQDFKMLRAKRKNARKK